MICLHLHHQDASKNAHLITHLQYFQAKVGEKWLPVIYGLLPNKEKVSYSIFFAMVKVELARQGLELTAEKMLVDFEIAIQQAAIETWPHLLIQGCRYWVKMICTTVFCTFLLWLCIAKTFANFAHYFAT